MAFLLQDDHFAYSYRLKPGVNRNSHGLKVAQLAGMPSSAVVVAKDVLVWLQSRSNREMKASELRSLGQSLTGRPFNNG
jgi:DNA mismatch repair ATPase MutS